MKRENRIGAIKNAGVTGVTAPNGSSSRARIYGDQPESADTADTRIHPSPPKTMGNGERVVRQRLFELAKELDWPAVESAYWECVKFTWGSFAAGATLFDVQLETDRLEELKTNKEPQTTADDEDADLASWREMVLAGGESEPSTCEATV
jgi:hypothetical protein